MAITDRQKENRKRALGASDIPAILGLDPFRSPFEVYAAKTDKIADPDEASEAAEWGTLVEPSLRSWAARMLGKPVVAPTGTFVHQTIPCMIANVDGLVEKSQRGSQIVECKHTGMWGPLGGQWGEEGTDQVPERVMVQVHAQMACAGSSVAHVVAQIMRKQGWPAMYYISRSEALIRAIEEEAAKFWERHVMADIPPEIDLENQFTVPSMDTMASLSRNDLKCIEIDPSLIEQFNTAREARLDAEKREEAHKVKMLAAMGDARMATGGVYEVKYAVESMGRRLNQGLLRERYPAIADECTQDATCQKLRVRDTTPKKKKGGK